MRSSPAAMLVTSVFPPEATVGIHRTVGLCQCLAASGWQVTVLTASPPGSSAIDAQLLEAVPESVHVIRTHAPDLPLIAAGILKWRPGGGRSRGKSERSGSGSGDAEPRTPNRRSAIRRGLDWLSWWLHIPDGRTGWFLPAVAAGAIRSLTQRPDVVFSSAPSWTAHLVGGCLSSLGGVPLVADFRDPWCGSAFRRIPYAAHACANNALERMVVRRAAAITCAWDGIRKHLVRRYPERTGDICTILNGFDPTSLDKVSPVPIESGRCVFIHAGGFYGPRSPVPLLRAIRHIKNSRPDIAKGVLIVLLGSPCYNGRYLEDIVAEYEVPDCVRVLPQVPRSEAVAFLKGADVALLFGQSGDSLLASVPAKAFEYVGVRKPVLAVGAGPEACRVMRSGGCAVWRPASGGPEDTASCVMEIWSAWREGTLGADRDSHAECDLTRARMGRQLETVLRGAIQPNAGAPLPAGMWGAGRDGGNGDVHDLQRRVR